MAQQVIGTINRSKKTDSRHDKPWRNPAKQAAIKET
jgi:hypothetical protein